MYVDFYKVNKNKESFRNKAKQKLVIDMHVDIKRGKDTMTDLECTYTEDIVPGDVFKPGLFSTFVYGLKNDSVSNVTFIDYMPIVLCCKKVGKHIYGLNFNMIPNEARAVVLDILDKSSGKFYSKVGIDNAANGVFVISDMISNVLLDDEKRSSLFRLIKTSIGFDISKAYRKYNISHISNPRYIEYYLLKYIPILDFGGSIKDADILKIQQAVIVPDKRSNDK